MFEYLGEQFVISEAQYRVLLEWISRSFYSRQAINYDYHAGRIKHWFEHVTGGFYVHEEIMVKAMLESGFRATQTKTQYWYFNISMRSPFFMVWSKNPQL